MAEEPGYLKNDYGICTKVIHDGTSSEKWSHKALVPPIVTSTMFDMSSGNDTENYIYGRISNPTRDCLEETVAVTENAKFSVVVSSGSAALNVAMHLLAVGDHLIAMDDLYGGTTTTFHEIAPRMGIEVDFVDTREPGQVEAAMKANTKMVWLETPTNPTMKLSDIAAVADIVKGHEGVVFVVDNTFMSPYFQRPLDLGADIVMHSISKYMNGHSDVIMGALITNREDLYERFRFLQKYLGPVPSVFDCFLVQRSLKTLPQRMEHHMKNGLAVARFLESHPCVEKVLHPGLPSHPQHQLSKRQCFGHSGMFTFYIKGDNLETSMKFMKNLKVFSMAVSLGGPESLCTHAATMTHHVISAEERARFGITDSLIRVSCGLEYEADLLADLDQALRAAVPQ